MSYIYNWTFDDIFSYQLFKKYTRTNLFRLNTVIDNFYFSPSDYHNMISLNWYQICGAILLLDSLESYLENCLKWHIFFTVFE